MTEAQETHQSAAPDGGEGFAPFSSEVQTIFAQAKDKSQSETLLALFFSPTAASQAAGRAFLQRPGTRREDREPPSGDQISLCPVECDSGMERL